MENYWKAVILVLITVIFGLTIAKTGKDFSMLLTMMACCLVCVIAVSYLKPVLDLLWEIHAIGELQNGLLGILIKAAGIAIIAELSEMICSDAGNQSLGKAVQLAGSAAVLYISIPVFQSLLTLIREILGDL